MDGKSLFIECPAESSVQFIESVCENRLMNPNIITISGNATGFGNPNTMSWTGVMIPRKCTGLSVIP
jgi:hypothetical protein